MSITFVHLSFHTILQLNYKMHSLNICVTSAQLGYSATIPQSIFTILCQDVEVQNPLTLTRGQSWSLVKTAFWREYTETPFFFCSARLWVFKLDSEPGVWVCCQLFWWHNDASQCCQCSQVATSAAGVASKKWKFWNAICCYFAVARWFVVLRLRRWLFCFSKFNCIMQQLLMPLAAYLKLKFIQICNTWSRFELSFGCAATPAGSIYCCHQ